MSGNAKVELLTFTGYAEDIIYTAAKQCKSEKDGFSIFWEENEKKFSNPCYNNRNLIKSCIKNGHLSVIEHVQFVFSISNISRICSHQLVRHRIASFSQQSQRYVNMSNQKFIYPETIKDHFEYSVMYAQILELSKSLYETMIKDGIPEEDARYVLPGAISTNLVLTMNCRSLINFFELRCCKTAQWEIQDVANKMLELCQNAFPVVFEDVGANCKACKQNNICMKNK